MNAMTVRMKRQIRAARSVPTGMGRLNFALIVTASYQDRDHLVAAYFDTSRRIQYDDRRRVRLMGRRGRR
jgi:hypothetical protein